MADAFDYIGETVCQDCGGSSLVFRATFDGGTPWIRPTKLRISVCRYDGSTYTVVTTCWSGIPGQGDTIYPSPIISGNPLLYRLATSRLPKLPPGVYYLMLEEYDTGGAVWVQKGSYSPIRIVPRSRFEEVFRMRSYWPRSSSDLPYAPGPKIMWQEPVIEA